MYLSENPNEELIAYVNIYLREEIQAEALVRKIQSFSKFLQTASLTSGKILNFNSVSNDTAIPASTIREFYHILEDTLVGFMLPAWTKTTKRKALSTAKFYFFDIGVKNQLSEFKNIAPNSDLFGINFEHFIGLELRAYISYYRKHLNLSYWCSVQGYEVDFIIGDEIAIEVKSSKSITSKHLKGLEILKEEKICKQYFLVSFDKIHRNVNGIQVIHWHVFLESLWNGEYF